MTQAHPLLLNSFGRRRGRRLRKGHHALMETLLPQLLITLPEGPLDLSSLFIHKSAPLWCEIGFGGGEHLVAQARAHPGVNFIGCEPYMNGMASLLSEINKDKLTNVRLYDDDARLILTRLPDDSIARLFVLFPDPWPKIRHHKRRIVSQEGLALFHRKLAPGGILRLATDHEDYGAWMLEHLQAFGKFTWTARTSSDWTTPPADWVRTRYQAKAEVEGRRSMFLEWIK